MSAKPKQARQEFRVDGLTDAERTALEHERQLAALRGQLQAANRRAQVANAALTEAQERFDALAAVREPVEWEPLVMTASKPADHVGIALIHWSDWHVGETVDRRKVHGLNHYTPEIARKRAAACAQSTVKILRHLEKSYKINGVQMVLGGDFISGYLHEELAQTNAFGPVEETMFAKELLFAALDLVVESSGRIPLNIVCHRGNHGRTTRKIQFKNDYATSYESWLYWLVQERYHDGKRCKVEVPRGDVHYAALLHDFRIRTYHGHQIGYQGGIGGVTVPLNRWQARQDETRKVQFNMHGHFHSYCMPNLRTVQNGALKGYDEFAASKGFPFEPPLQTLALLDCGRKRVAQHLPIFCE